MRPAGKVGGAHRPRGPDPRQQGLHLAAVLAPGEHGPPERPVAFALAQPCPVQADVGRWGHARLVRPAFGQLPAGQGVVQPLHRVIADARAQHQVLAARDHVDRIDLQQAHALDGVEQVAAPRPPPRCLQQPLRGQVQVPGLRHREDFGSGTQRAERHGGFTPRRACC